MGFSTNDPRDGGREQSLKERPVAPERIKTNIQAFLIHGVLIPS